MFTKKKKNTFTPNQCKLLYAAITNILCIPCHNMDTAQTAKTAHQSYKKRQLKCMGHAKRRGRIENLVFMYENTWQQRQKKTEIYLDIFNDWTINNMAATLTWEKLLYMAGKNGEWHGGVKSWHRRVKTVIANVCPILGTWRKRRKRSQQKQ